MRAGWILCLPGLQGITPAGVFQPVREIETLTNWNGPVTPYSGSKRVHNIHPRSSIAEALVSEARTHTCTVNPSRIKGQLLKAKSTRRSSSRLTTSYGSLIYLFTVGCLLLLARLISIERMVRANAGDRDPPRSSVRKVNFTIAPKFIKTVDYDIQFCLLILSCKSFEIVRWSGTYLMGRSKLNVIVMIMKSE